MITTMEANKTVPTIAQVLEMIRRDKGLGPNKRRYLFYAVRSTLKHTRLNPETTPAHFDICRKAAARFYPASANISDKQWRLVRGRTCSAFNRYTGYGHYHRGDPLGPTWRALRHKITDKHLYMTLARFIRYCDYNGIAPERITDAVMDAFRIYLERHTPTAKPLRCYRNTCISWNTATETIPGWPKVRVSIPASRRRWSLSLSEFPASFAADLHAYGRAATATEPLWPRALKRPLRPSTVRHKLYFLRYFASAVVKAGVVPSRIKNIASLLEPGIYRRGIEYLWEKNGCKPIGAQADVANELATAGRYWVNVSARRYDELRQVAYRLDRRRNGLVDQTRRILRQLDDPRNVRKLLALPKKLSGLASRCPNKKKAASLMQKALAIELLLVAPIRLGSLHRLRIKTNFIFAPHRNRSPETVYLHIPSEEAKTHSALEFELPKATIALLTRYVRHHLPILSKGDSDALFPGDFGTPKTPSGFSAQIRETVARYAGIEINVHSFRHVAARLYLDRFPQEYFLVGMLLGHRSVTTTMTKYCELGTQSAARQYNEQVLGKKFARPCAVTTRLRANRAKEIEQAHLRWRRRPQSRPASFR